MKLLWFSHMIPYPPQGGNLQRSFNLIRQSSQAFSVDLFAFNLQGYSAAQIKEYTQELKKYCSKVEIWDLPYGWRSPAWWAHLLWSSMRKPPFSCQALWSPRLADRWRRTLQNYTEALIHFDSPDLALYVDAASGFKKVLNHHNCESAMAYRRAEVESNPLKKMYLRIHAHKLARLEEELCHRFEANTAVSALDADILRARNPRAHFHVVPNGTDVEYFSPSGEPEEPNSLIFAGSLDWYPNLSGLDSFLKDAWPKLKRQRPEVRFYLAGKNPTASVFRWAGQDSNITVVASPADMRPWLARGAVFICPIMDGGGTRLKILDAMAMGKCVVSTSVGCEGLEVTNHENILVADSAEDFAGEIQRALDDPGLRRRIAAAGRAFVEKHYSWASIGRELIRTYQCALTGGECKQVHATSAETK